jgi:alpha-beta hydrolase superfamily lysophospholipase
VQAGSHLLLRWDAAGPPIAVVVAVHGLKGSATLFDAPARRWAAAGIVTYAGTLAFPPANPVELRETLAEVIARHPALPLYVVGESLGASLVVLTLAAGDGVPAVAGIVLAAPAVWPDPITATVTISVLDMVAGASGQKGPAYWSDVFTLMDRTRNQAAALAAAPVLVLSGDRDDVVPHAGVEALVSEVGDTAELLNFPQGSHALFRDGNGDAVADQVAEWLLKHRPNAVASMPSGPDSSAGGAQATAK